MLSASSPTSPKNERQADISSFLVYGNDKLADDFSAGNFLDDINLDDLFIRIDYGDDMPDLEVDPDILAEFSSVESEVNTSPSSSTTVEEKYEGRREEEEKALRKPTTVEDRREGSVVTTNSSASDVSRGRKPATKVLAKESQGKRKVKVDWTPELHRRFVQAVEQLGVDKAVPSRILELMGIDCLTRHNIASHLQKYRSHRKHMLAREAEAANWSQRRQVYGGGNKMDASPWVAHTMGFPPPAAVQPFRPLHVWGHPTVDQSMIHVWPKHIVHSPPPLQPPWAPPPPNLPYWHQPLQQLGSKGAWIPSAPIQGTPCFSQLLTAPRPVPGIPPHAMYTPGNNVAIPSGATSNHNLQFDFHPSKETVDAAIEDVLAKPWQPHPLGLKPPSTESVLVELQLQGITKLPPSRALMASPSD